MMNRQGGGTGLEDRGQALVDAVYRALGTGARARRHVVRLSVGGDGRCPHQRRPPSSGPARSARRPAAWSSPSATAVTRIRGDRDDVFSRGFICPKGTALGHLHDDPDRLHGPLVRRDGELRAATWEEAFAEVARRLPPIIQRHGRDTVAVYVGNPTVHNLSGILYSRLPLRARSARATSSPPAPSTSGPRRSPARCCSGRWSATPSPT